MPTDPLIAAFRAMPVSIVSDNLARMGCAVGLRPMHRGRPMCGPALTLRTRAGDNMGVHAALARIAPGEVLVIDAGGDVSRAVTGEIMKLLAQSRGAEGFVIDGAIRDSAAFAADDFPCFARGVCHLGPFKHGPFTLGEPVAVGGLVIRAGDWVVGDADGVAAFAPGRAAALLAACEAQLAREAETMAQIREGRYEGRYGAP